MKKTLLSFAVAVMATFSFASAQNLPDSLPDGANYSFSAVNISQGNKDATSTAARPGDTIRYQAEITSNTNDVTDFIAEINISDILKAADLVDSGLGTLTGNGVLSYPAYSQKAPCNKKFTFFVRVKQNCGEMQAMTANANNYADVNVQLNCLAEAPTPEFTPEPTHLPQVGPRAGAIIGFIIFLTILLIVQMSYRKRRS